MEGMEMIKKSEELEFLLDIQEHDRRTFWFKPLPWGCKMSLFFVLLTMEVYSAHDWRDHFFYRETNIYEETNPYCGREEQNFVGDDRVKM